MRLIFQGATAFNSDIRNWDTRNVTSFLEAFANAKAFNQDISGWDTSSAESMSGMFLGASQFSQDLSGWNIPNLIVKVRFDKGSGFVNNDQLQPDFAGVGLPPIISEGSSVLDSSGTYGEHQIRFPTGDVDGFHYNGGTPGNTLANFISDVGVELFIGAGDFLGVLPTLTVAQVLNEDEIILKIDATTITLIKGNVLRITFPAGLLIDTPPAGGTAAQTSAEQYFEFVVQ